MSTSNRVFVGKVAQATNEQTLMDEFSKFGDVTKIDLKSGYAFVFFENDDDTIKAIENLDGKEIDGNNIVVEAARSARDFKQKPVKRLDLRLSVSGLENRVSWQDLKDWARKAGDVTFTNIFMRDETLKGVIEFTDAEGMENALRTLEDVPLKGLNLRLEKDESGHQGSSNNNSNADRPYRPIPRYQDGPPHGGPPRGGYDDRMGGPPMRGYNDRDRDSRGSYDRGPYHGGGDRGGDRDRYMQGPPMGDRYDGPPPYRGGGYADYRMGGGGGGPDPRGGGGFRGDSRGPPMDVRGGGPPLMDRGGYYPPPPRREGRSRSRSRSRDRGGPVGGDQYYRGGGGGGGGMHGPPPGGPGMYPPRDNRDRGGGGYERGPQGGQGPYERGPPPAGGGGRFYEGGGNNRGAGGNNIGGNGGGGYNGGVR